MIGYTPVTRSQHELERHKNILLEYGKTTDIDKLMQPDAVLAEEIEEATEELCKQYPDVEPGYGQVYHNSYRIFVMTEPGLTTTNIELAEALCRKYGKIRCWVRAYVSNYHESGFVITGEVGSSAGCYIRHDEKVKRKRGDKKIAPPKRNFSFIKSVVDSLYKIERDTDYPAITQALRYTYNLKFDASFSVHERVLMLLEIFLATSNNGKAILETEKYKTLAEEWFKAKEDKITDPNSLKSIELLTTLFQQGK